MKKTSLLLAVLLTFSLLSGCGNQETPVETTVPVTTAPQQTTAPTTLPTEPPAPVVIDFKLELPEGFELSLVQDNIQVFSSPKSPRDPSYVSVQILPRDESVLTMDTTQMIHRILEPVVVETPEIESSTPSAETTAEETTEPEETTQPEETTEPQEAPEPFVKFLEPATVDEWDAVFTDYVQSYDNYTSHTYRYEVVTTDANYVFSFCDGTDDNEWLDAFEEASHDIDLILDTEGMELDYSQLTPYVLRSGLSIHAEEGLESHDAQGFSDALANRNVLILTMGDDKVSNNLTEMDLHDYADLVAKSNDLETFQEDMYGNLFTTFYSRDEAGLEYYNMICVKETTDSFWVCQMTCLAKDQVSYAKVFPLWASSIK